MADTLNFKVTGMLNGLHQIEMEDGESLSVDDAGLAKLERAHNRLATNDKWPNRPESDAPVAGGQGGDNTAVLIAFADLKQAFGKLSAEHQILLGNQASLEERIVALEIAADAKTEAVASEPPKGKEK